MLGAYGRRSSNVRNRWKADAPQMSGTGGKWTFGHYAQAMRLFRMRRGRNGGFWSPEEYRKNIITSLAQLAAASSAQRNIGFPPEQFRLDWEGSYSVVDEAGANEVARGSFQEAELIELAKFDRYMWSLPPEPDPMWHRDNLDAEPWPEIRGRATELIELLRSVP
jgi:hypothetical protein